MLLPTSIIPGLNIKWAVIVALVVGLVIAIYSHGRHVAAGEVAAAQRDTALAYAAEIVKQQATADDLTAENAALRARQEPKNRIITKEITRYVEIVKPDQRCTLPGPWRLRHDAAATGDPSIAEAGTMADGRADPVDDATALQIVGANYTACRDAIAKVKGWQRRYQALEAPDEKSH